MAGHTCLIIGILDIASAISPHMQETRIERIAPYVPGLAEEVARAAALAAGLLLVMLARGLRRRKRRAWEAAVGLLAVSALVQGVRHHALIPATVSVVLCVALVAYREEFYALGDPRGRTRALWNLVVLGGSSFGLGLLVVGVRANQEAGHAITFADRVQEVGYGLIGASGPIAYRSDRAGDIVYFSLLALGVVTAATSAYLALRPVTLRRADSDERLRALLADEGRRDSLGYFALRGDKSVLFSPSGKAAVAYRVVSGVALAGGDPIGDHEAWPGAIKEFLRSAAGTPGPPPSWGAASPADRSGSAKAGSRRWSSATRPSSTAGLQPSGRTMRNVRQMVNRIERAGYTCDAPRTATCPTRRASGCARPPRLARQRHRTRVLHGARPVRRPRRRGLRRRHRPPGRRGGKLRGLLHFVPWGDDGLSLDLMRRDRDGRARPERTPDRGRPARRPRARSARMSLNFAVFRAALARGERLGAGPVLRAWRGLLVFLSRWFQIESLYRFNAKFRPEWEPRFVFYPTVRDLPRISWALQAEAFVVLPHPAERLRQSLRKRPAAREEKPQPVKVTTRCTSRWLTSSASAAWAVSQRRCRAVGSSAQAAGSQTANGSQMRSVSALLIPERSAASTASSTAARGRSRRGRRRSGPAGATTPRRAVGAAASVRRSPATVAEPDDQHGAGEVAPYPVGVRADPARALVVALDQQVVALPPVESGEGERGRDRRRPGSHEGQRPRGPRVSSRTAAAIRAIRVSP